MDLIRVSFYFALFAILAVLVRVYLRKGYLNYFLNKIWLAVRELHPVCPAHLGRRRGGLLSRSLDDLFPSRWIGWILFPFTLRILCAAPVLDGSARPYVRAT